MIRPLTLLAMLLAGGAAGAAERIVSVGGAVTEIVYALGAQPELVGVDTTSTWPLAVKTLPQVGYARTLGAEGLLSLRPTLLLAGHEAGPPAALDQVAAAGVRLVHLQEGYDAASLAGRIAAVGAALGRQQDADVMAEAVRADMAAVARAVAGQPTPGTLFLLSLSRGGLQAAGTGTSADAAIRLAGGRNVIDSYKNYRALSPESAILLAPDYIVTTTDAVAAVGSLDAILALPEVAVTPAARARRIVALDVQALLGFGPREPATLRTLALALHPGLTIPELPARAWNGVSGTGAP